MTLDQDGLLRGEIRLTHRLTDASNATLLGEIEAVGKVIYKPIAGERPLWDFPHGTLADREVATFKVSNFFRLDLVPPTVLRDGPFGEGMVQLWIDNDPEVDLITFGQGNDPQLRTLALFDALINNTDRKFGHLLVDVSGRLFGCDHGVTFHSQDKLRTVLWQFASDAFDENEIDLLERIERERDALSILLGEHLIDEEVEAFFSRANRLRTDGQFPQPSEEWPAVPWPPV